jgi:hypothetical protein
VSGVLFAEIVLKILLTGCSKANREMRRRIEGPKPRRITGSWLGSGHYSKNKLDPFGFKKVGLSLRDC